MSEEQSLPRQEEQEEEPKTFKRKRGGLVELLVIVLVAFVLVFGVIRPFVMEAFWIPSESMTPTLEVGDRVFVNKFIYRFTEPERGDVIVFDSVESTGEGRRNDRTLVERIGEAFGFVPPEAGEEELIKRVVALPGDRVSFRRGVLRVNGEIQDEPYLDERRERREVFGPERVPEGHVFVMGDNRRNSADSRVFGPVPYENIEGEAFVTFWPPTRIGPL